MSVAAAGVGSEVYGAVLNGRRGVGVELHPAYFRQAVLNLQAAAAPGKAAAAEPADLFGGLDTGDGIAGATDDPTGEVA